MPQKLISTSSECD